MGLGVEVYICHKAFNENKLFMARHNKNTQNTELRSQAKWQKDTKQRKPENWKCCLKYGNKTETSTVIISNTSLR